MPMMDIDLPAGSTMKPANAAERTLHKQQEAVV
jgi:hypothetical protein